jgi:hypothetical protein
MVKLHIKFTKEQHGNLAVHHAAKMRSHMDAAYASHAEAKEYGDHTHHPGYVNAMNDAKDHAKKAVKHRDLSNFHEKEAAK